ncbi:MAG: hypothetical protein R6U12_09255, partial [Thioalkalivibrio sp.]
MDASSTSTGTSDQRPGVLQDVRTLARELRGLFHDQVGLAALETRQAGESLVWMVILGVMVGGLLLIISPRKGTVTVRGGKGEKFRTVPLNVDTRRALRA